MSSWNRLPAPAPVNHSRPRKKWERSRRRQRRHRAYPDWDRCRRSEFNGTAAPGLGRRTQAARAVAATLGRHPSLPVDTGELSFTANAKQLISSVSTSHARRGTITSVPTHAGRNDAPAGGRCPDGRGERGRREAFPGFRASRIGRRRKCIVGKAERAQPRFAASIARLRLPNVARGRFRDRTLYGMPARRERRARAWNPRSNRARQRQGALRTGVGRYYCRSRSADTTKRGLVGACRTPRRRLPRCCRPLVRRPSCR